MGEVPFGHITDKIGYKNSLILYQALLLIARALLFAAFLSRSLLLFVVEAVVEGAAFCFASGTSSAYLYELHGEEGYLAKALVQVIFDCGLYYQHSVLCSNIRQFGIARFVGCNRNFGCDLLHAFLLYRA